MGRRMRVLDDKPRDLLETYLDRYAQIFPIDKDEARKETLSNAHFLRMTQSWYDLLEDCLDTAYNVYNHEKYYQDVWNCFAQYSRRYLRDLRANKMPDGENFVEYAGNIRGILDVGCGTGYGTLGLKELFPSAKVYGLNLKETKQWKFCESLFADYTDVELKESYLDLRDIDLVFASEFFEHIHDPFEYVDSLVEALNPKWLVIANSFNTRSIGHFLSYKKGTEIIDQKKASKMFNNHLQSLNYVKIKTKLYNNRPNIWLRT
jgi:SAM-dependent methyltransferase